MSLNIIRLELARTKETPEGNANCGYEFVAPLDAAGRFDEKTWRSHRGACTVRRFWENANNEYGMLVHTKGRRWVFSYAPGEDDDEPVFKLDRHTFKEGDYVSVTEHDGVTRPFKIVSVNRIVAQPAAAPSQSHQ
jgi:hypothetical protein